MSADFRELEAFRDKMQNLAEHGTQELCEECTKELAARLLAKVIKRTPVGAPPDSYNIVDGKKIKKTKDEMKEVRKKRRETVTVKGDSGKQRKMLTAYAARYQQYWSGYVGGTLRRGWTAGQQIGAREYARGLRVDKDGKYYKIVIINQVEYAIYVEYGHRQEPGRYVPALGKRLKASWVHGQFMMTKSVSEVDAIAQAVVDKKVNDFLKKELGND